MSFGSVNSVGERAANGDVVPQASRAEATRLQAAFRERLHSYSATEHALRALRELMLAAPSAPAYAQRRAAFLRVLRDDPPTSGFTARILRYFAVDAPELTFDDRDALVHAVIEHSGDDEALVLFLLAMTDQADAVRPIIDRITGSDRAFPILSRLFTAPWLDSFRHILAAKLLEAARNRQGAFRVWVREDPDTFFQPELFELFLRGGGAALGGVCKEILIHGPTHQREQLVAQLENEGTESALRLLVLGLPFGGRPCHPILLAAIASFQHELAVAALREVIHCGNVQQEHTDDAVRAMRALHSMDTEDSREFIDEIADGRYALLPTYRKQLRRGASALRGDGGRK